MASARRLLPSLGVGFAVAMGVSALRRLRRFELSGKTALVTGGSRGLGLEIARVLVDRGARVAVVARNPEELDRAVHLLRDQAPESQLLGVPCDLGDGSAIDGMLAAVHAELGPIDVLVNCAGGIQVGPLDALTVEDFEALMRLHCFAPLRTMLGVREEMKARGGGRIANVSSGGGLVSVPHLLPYSTSKFALEGLSQGMHAELAADGTVVTTIAPGLMRTGSARNATFKGDHQKEHAWFTLSDSLPLISMSSGRAARRIVSAIEYGEAHVVLGAPAKAAALANNVFPGVVTGLLSLVTGLLPKGTDRQPKAGKDSESPVAPSVFTAATDQAARRNNEL